MNQQEELHSLLEKFAKVCMYGGFEDRIEAGTAIETFAASAILKEREECAKLCEGEAFVEQWKGLAEAAKRIRARGNS